MKKELPYRPSSLEERKRFYEKEFPLEKAKKWFKKNGLNFPQICAIDAGTETGIIQNEKWKGIMFYFPSSELEEKIKKYNPEDVYYDRNIYENPKKILKTLRFSKPLAQELVFDIDSDNIPCRNHGKEKVCRACLKKAYKYALKMKKELSKIFKNIILVYSGRGFHIHVLDKDAFNLSFKERDSLNKKFSKYPIDPWVSGGRIRLIRMPYSLNALVSRRATPLNIKNKFKETETIPAFMKNL